MLPSFLMIDHESDPIKAEQWIMNLKILGLLGLVGGLSWGGVTFFKKMEEKSQTKAFSQLAKVEAMEDELLKSSEILSKDPIEVIAEAKVETQEQYVSELKAVIKDHPKTSASFMAALRLGRYYSLKNEVENVKTVYQALREQTQSSEDASLFYAMASEALAVTLVNQGDLDGALKVYDDALGRKYTSLKPVLMLGKARTQGAMGLKAEATSTYDSIVKDYPSTTYSQQAQALKVKVSL